MKTRPKLLIFDVDGTLTHSAGLGRVAYEMAVEEIYGIRNSAAGIKPHGRTDQSIFREILERNGLGTDDFTKQHDSFSDRYIGHLERLLNSSDKVHLHAGVRQLLDMLALKEDIHLALGTGNIQRGAWAKLRRHGVEHYFPAGGYGCDSEDRTELLRIGCQRAEAHYGIEFPLDDIWIIGDTPYDIECGRRLGAKTMAVANGNYSVDQLETHHPDALFPDFEDRREFLAVIRDRAD